MAGGTRNHAEWAWLTGSLVAQTGQTPLHRAAYGGQKEAIEALVEAKADVHVKDKVRWGVLGGRGGGRVCILLSLYVVLDLRF